MRAKKDDQTGKWKIQYRYTTWDGKIKNSTKRGFTTKREAEEWYRDFMQTKQADISMKFEDFIELYYTDMSARLRENTMQNKKYLIGLKILPFFGQLKMSDIKPRDVRMWQNTLMKENFKPTYLKTINNQLCAIFNYAVQYYDLRANPCHKAGSMGKKNADEMFFWTKGEFTTFIDGVTDKHMTYMAFTILYWTGIRIGELLALTKADVDIENKILNISKSYQRLNKKDVITEPKTEKSKRKISLPEFLIKDLEDYVGRIYGDDDARLFPVTKGYFNSELNRGIKATGVKKIRVHDLRHSHTSLLIDMGFTPLEIAERLGHERIETTMNTYGHLYPNKQHQLASKLDDLYKEEV